jgi:short-subunit dehydrogenase
MALPKTILITGASSGIGAALAIAYAGEGRTLILLARNEARLNEVAAQCRAKGAVVHTASIDVRDSLRLKQFIEEIDTKCPVDLVIANAGISAGFSNSVEENYQRAEEVFAVNLGGVIHTIHPLLPRMIARGRGHIAILSSLAGIVALPSAPAYSTSKAAVRVYGDALRGELRAHHIDVSVICPGWITTPLTEKNDFPMPFCMNVERAAGVIIHRLAQKKRRIAFPLALYLPLRIMAAMPVFVSDRLMGAMPKKRLKS